MKMRTKIRKEHTHWNNILRKKIIKRKVKLIYETLSDSNLLFNSKYFMFIIMSLKFDCYLFMDPIYSWILFIHVTYLMTWNLLFMTSQSNKKLYFMISILFRVLFHVVFSSLRLIINEFVSYIFSVVKCKWININIK